ncbi:hypothetical protein RN001_014998 [Aquatica leii]|uniref:Uncharacterized protein n=1 Tax=Aquatica leii TaxID=1421715 RepID=A0AAN7SC13_9COLE|nr:hypothetical protein RN001_014998 [Aquatica leii]
MNISTYVSAKPTYNNGIITTSNHHKYKPDTRGVGYVFFKSFKKFANRTLQINGFTGEEDTYGSVLQRSIRIALKLLEFGLTPNDVISTCSLNHFNSCVPIFASLFIGVTSASFDHRMHDAEAALLMEQISPKVIFVDSASLSFVESTLKAANKTAMIIVFGETSKYINFFDLLAPSPDEHKFRPIEIDETQIAFIFFTSGSTGLPKAVCLSHRVFLEQIAVPLDLNEPYDRIWDSSTFYWTSCTYFWAILIMKGGCKIIVPFDDNIEEMWQSISNYNPTYMFITPYELRWMWKLKPDDICVDSIKTVDIGGGTLPEHELIMYKNFFSKAKVALEYGSTEAGLVLFFKTETKKGIKFLSKKTMSSGSVLNGISYKIVDVDTEQILGPYQKGELRLKSKSLFDGYYNSDATSEFDSDGWFKTGDIFYYDKDYYFYFVERLKLMIKYRDLIISPKIIENVLMLRDDICAACVIGIEHNVDDEHLMAVVEVNDVHKIEDNFEKNVCHYLKEKLGDKFLLDEGVKIVDKIPFTASGKYDIRKLKLMFKTLKIV